MSKKMLTPVLVLAMSAMGAHAQSTVKELLDKGGKKLSAVELKAVASGATLSGASPQAGNKAFTFAFDLAPSGELSGKGWTPEWMAPVKGRWSVNSAGQFCSHMANAAANDKGNCGNFYKLENTYFTAAGDEKGVAEPDAPVIPREFTRIASTPAAAPTAPKAP